MDIELKNKINTALQQQKSIEVINSSDFYFQKAKDALHNFLELEVSEEVKLYLLVNRKNYNELKQLFEDSQDFNDFGKSILKVISYCDSNAHKKRELNEYDDKRVLALAFVRMNNWVEQLITYKFEGQLAEGSVKNAIDYLLNPLDNFTMLSENHRSQVAQNLFKKPYIKDRFKDDFFNYFSELLINVKNQENYTHLLSRLCYYNEVEKDWKDNIIGLICPDSTGWQEDAINDSKNGYHIALWNHKKPNGIAYTLKLLRQCIEENGFFRIFYTSNYKVNYVAEIVDFVSNQKELDNANWPKNYGNIEWFNDIYSNYKDQNKSASWVYLARKIFKVNSEDYLNFQYYKSNNYPSVGCQAPIVSFKNSLEINREKKMNQNINLLKYKKQIILQGPPGTGKTREAKLIAKDILGLQDVKDLKNNNQFKLIQFHPSYTYEDFVRGIVAKPNSEEKGIIYEAENKTLGIFAKMALENYLLSQDNNSEVFQDKWIEDKFNDFKVEIDSLISENQLILSGAIGIYKIENDCFRYGKDWQFPSRINFHDFKLLIKAVINNKLDINSNEIPREISVHAHYRFTYYLALLRLFHSNNVFVPIAEKEKLKKYILVIDEINRANLSSVLGELIYALEYRGEIVESMYDVDGNDLILPPNLYIIGTMNTADRSIGHIDYAIRRRFAFVNIEPKDLSDEKDVVFDAVLFNQVAQLFDTNLSPEFKKEEVQLGHSYFIDKSKEDDGVSMAMRFEYEIQPILEEYIKDGVLIGDDINIKIKTLTPSL